MAVAANLLQRFRPAGAPGSASPAGVPEDVADRRATELAPVFAALAPVHDEATAITAAAEARARQQVHDAAQRAAAVRAGAATEAEALRAELLARARAEADEELRGRAAAARGRADEIATAARASLESDVATVLARVRLRVLAAVSGKPR